MRLHIDRLELDLRGDISATVAQDALGLLGPALADELAEARRTAPRASAGGHTPSVAAQPDAALLARQLARQLAPQLAAHLSPRRSAGHAPRGAAQAIAAQGGATPTTMKRRT